MKKKATFNQKAFAFFQILLLIPAAAGFYTAVSFLLLMQFISLEPIFWRCIVIIFFTCLNIIGFYWSFKYFKKNGNFDL